MITIKMQGHLATLDHLGPDGEIVRTEKHLLDSLSDLRDALEIADDYSEIELDKLPLFGPEPEGEDCAGWVSCDDEYVLMYDGVTWTIEARDDR